ncbi:MAG: hypothetical protein NT028_08380 [candidate division Zixibacteria bacterium]|nr:hypothetical protein [candidate division Zixibacteria bacterium]
MFFPFTVIAGFITIAIVLHGIARKSPRLLLWVNVLLWLMATASLIPIISAWRDRAYSENWALIGVMAVSAPSMLIIVILSAVLLFTARRKRISLTKPMIISLLCLAAFLALQLALVVMTARSPHHL